MRYILLLIGLVLLIFDELNNQNQTKLSVLGLLFFVFGLYLISKKISDKPDYNPYSIKSYDEEE